MNIDLIPQDILITIFSFLDHREVLRNIALVCKQFNNEFAKSEVLWKELCMNVYLYRRRELLANYFKRKFLEREYRIEDVTSDQSTLADEDEEEIIADQLLTISEEEIRSWFETIKTPPKSNPYTSWKQYFRYYIMWGT